MTYQQFEEKFCALFPVVFNAAPIIGTLLGSPATGIIIGLLAQIVGVNACDHDKIAAGLASEDDLYTKLVRLEQTHAEWLKIVAMAKAAKV